MTVIPVPYRLRQEDYDFKASLGCIARPQLSSLGFLLMVKRHHDHGNSCKGKNISLGWLTISQVQSIIIMVRYGSVQEDMVLER